ncbi:MAG: hypothetical protein HQK54_15135, partial [Oligoflexales bacterium]|nr:hypothetical protein [Oligoflexales bacterium]
MITLNDAIVEVLKALGVRQVFGVSGANIEHLHDSIFRRGGSKLSAVLAKSESGAAFMADGLARSQNTLGVCCSTSGGGMMNMAVGLAESYADRVPILALIGQPPDTLAGLGAFQDSSGRGRSLDAYKLFSAMSAFVKVFDSTTDFWSTMTEAIQRATSLPKGPAVLLIPRNRWETPVSRDENELNDQISIIINRLQAQGKES